MKEKSDKLNPPENQADSKEENNYPGYPIYPDGDDIYKNFQEEKDINPEDTSKTKEPNITNALRRKDLEDEYSEGIYFTLGKDGLPPIIDSMRKYLAKYRPVHTELRVTFVAV